MGDASTTVEPVAPPDQELVGWEEIAALTGGVAPEQIDELKAVRTLEPVYPLLHALVGRSMRDFLVRAAALQALVQSGRPAFEARDSGTSRIATRKSSPYRARAGAPSVRARPLLREPPERAGDSRESALARPP